MPSTTGRLGTGLGPPLAEATGLGEVGREASPVLVGQLGVADRDDAFGGQVAPPSWEASYRNAGVKRSCYIRVMKPASRPPERMRLPSGLTTPGFTRLP